jgi:hypothetical protein
MRRLVQLTIPNTFTQLNPAKSLLIIINCWLRLGGERVRQYGLREIRQGMSRILSMTVVTVNMLVSIRYRWQSERFITLKIINNRSADDAGHERDIEEHIGQQTVPHRGRGIIRTCLESFEVTGPVDRHLCLAYEPLREPLWILQKRFVNQKLPLPIAKAYILILLAGLDFLHSECRVVHTGKQPCSFIKMSSFETVLIYLQT